MSDIDLIDRIVLFFETYFSIIRSKDEENKMYEIKHEIDFFCSIFYNLNQIKLNNTDIMIGNYSINFQHKNRWKENYHLVQSKIYRFAIYFSYGITYEIFTEIENLISNKIYKISEKSIKSKFNYEKNKIDLVNPNTSEIMLGAIGDLYVCSMNKIMYEILTKFNENYEEYIKNNNMYEKMLSNYKEILKKYGINSLPFTYIYGLNLINNIKGNEFGPEYIHYGLFNSWNYGDEYELYNELWNMCKKYYDMLEMNEKMNK
jgi:hypothetical protein